MGVAHAPGLQRVREGVQKRPEASVSKRRMRGLAPGLKDQGKRMEGDDAPLIRLEDEGIRLDVRKRAGPHLVNPPRFRLPELTKGLHGLGDGLLEAELPVLSSQIWRLQDGSWQRSY